MKRRLRWDQSGVDFKEFDMENLQPPGLPQMKAPPVPSGACQAAPKNKTPSPASSGRSGAKPTSTPPSSAGELPFFLDQRD